MQESRSTGELELSGLASRKLPVAAATKRQRIHTHRLTDTPTEACAATLTGLEARTILGLDVLDGELHLGPLLRVVQQVVDVQNGPREAVALHVARHHHVRLVVDRQVIQLVLHEPVQLGDLVVDRLLIHLHEDLPEVAPLLVPRRAVDQPRHEPLPPHHAAPRPTALLAPLWVPQLAHQLPPPPVRRGARAKPRPRAEMRPRRPHRQQHRHEGRTGSLAVRGSLCHSVLLK